MSSIDIKVSEIEIPCIGYSLKADWYQTASDDVLLVLPGYTSTKKKYQELVSYIVEKSNVSALVIDYRGHGESPFVLEDLSRADNFRDVVAAFDWIKKNHPDKKITVMGTSYGGFHTAYLTKFRTFERAVFRVPASYPEETLYTRIGDMEDAHSKRYRNDSKNYINHWLFTHTESVKNNVLVVTHEFDDVCVPKATMPFVKAFGADHWEAKGFRHGFGESDVTEKERELYYQKIVDWLGR